MLKFNMLQYSIRKQKSAVIAQFMRDSEVLRADVIAIQEPWQNPSKGTTHHPAQNTHELVYPAQTKGERARVCLFVSKRLTGWTHIAHSLDCQEIRLHGTNTEVGEVRLINIYNDARNHGALHLLPALLPECRGPNDPQFVILGDFNLHHPLWRGPEAKADAKAEDLLDIMEISMLDCWVPEGTITRSDKASCTTIDLVLASWHLCERLINCEARERVHADSDHMPLQTLVDISTPGAPEAPGAAIGRPWRCPNSWTSLRPTLTDGPGPRGPRASRNRHRTPAGDR